MAEIYGSELVTDVFGYWPSFHDAEVVRLSLERTTDYERGPHLFLDVHAFEITRNTDAHGRYILQHHSLLNFRFDGVQDLAIQDFNNQNVLFGIRFDEVGTPAFPEPAYKVVLEGAHGISADFLCRKVMVTGITPWDPEDRTPLGSA